jgi:hypothetical protein
MQMFWQNNNGINFEWMSLFDLSKRITQQRYIIYQQTILLPLSKINRKEIGTTFNPWSPIIRHQHSLF